MKNHVAIFLCITFLAVPGGDAVGARLKPLTCKMKAALVEAAAIGRDKGLGQREIGEALLSGGDLTQKEVQAVINVAFAPDLRRLSPLEISNMAYKTCVRLSEQAEDRSGS